MDSPPASPTHATHASKGLTANATSRPLSQWIPSWKFSAALLLLYFYNESFSLERINPVHCYPYLQRLISSPFHDFRLASPFLWIRCGVFVFILLPRLPFPFFIALLLSQFISPKENSFQLTMSEASHRRRRSFSKRRYRVDKPVHISLIRRSPQPRKKTTNKIPPRCASEPILWIVQLVPDDVISESDKREDPPVFINPTFYSCYDLFESPSHVQASPRLLDPSEEENKVLVSVNVEGSVGPIKALVKLGTSVEEAIKAVLQRYRNEGRSPSLGAAAAASFQLHHSHFSLQSLNKNDKIGEVGGRSFYLRKNCETNGSYSGTGESNLVTKRSTNIISSVKIQAVNTSQLFMSFIVKKCNKIKRRAIRLWKVVTCDN